MFCIFFAVDVEFEIPIVTFDLQDSFSCGLFKYRLKWKIYFPESFIGTWIETKIRRTKLM